jgi:transposase-like protein
MKQHANSALTQKQRKLIQTLYARGNHSQSSLAKQFGTTRKTIGKWVHRTDVSDRSSAPHSPRRRITPIFEAAVAAYRKDERTSHHGKIRIAKELEKDHACSNPSNVGIVLLRLTISKPAERRKVDKKHLPVGKHRTQMDIQQLPAIEGNTGFEYKISIIHLSSRMKYSEIHPDTTTRTVAQVFQNALERLPPFSSLLPTTPEISP